MAFGDVELRKVSHRTAEIFDGILTEEPWLADGSVARAEALGQLNHEMIAVAKILVEGWSGETGSRHDTIDRHFPKRELSQKALGSIENFGFGSLWFAPPAARFFRLRSMASFG